jgi:putative membrane protein
MKWMLLPATALVVLAGCSPASDRGDTAAGGTPGSETGMASTDTGMTGSGATTGTGSAGATTPAGTMDASGVLSQLAVANQTEIQQGQAAAKKATSPTVKQFANTLVKDHKANSQKLQQLAKKMGVTLADSGAQTTTESQSATMGELSGKTGKEFDQAFIDAQIQAHEENIDKIRNQLLPAADQPELRDYLQQTAAAMEGHLASAKQLKQDLSSTS